MISTFEKSRKCVHENDRTWLHKWHESRCGCNRRHLSNLTNSCASRTSCTCCHAEARYSFKGGRESGQTGCNGVGKWVIGVAWDRPGAGVWLQACISLKHFYHNVATVATVTAFHVRVFLYRRISLLARAASPLRIHRQSVRDEREPLRPHPSEQHRTTTSTTSKSWKQNLARNRSRKISI